MAYKLEEVARSICSSSALLDEDPNQPAMVPEGEAGACLLEIQAKTMCVPGSCKGPRGAVELDETPVCSWQWTGRGDVYCVGSNLT